MERHRPRAIMLDMDDTIISFDHGVDTDACWRSTVSQHLPQQSEEAAAQIVSSIKEKARWYWSDPERHRIGRQDLYLARLQFLAAVLEERNIDQPDLAHKLATTYGEERDLAITIFPDSIDAIQQLRSKGIKLAMITNGNSKMQWEKINRFDLAPLFDLIVVEGDLGIGKPDERIYAHVLEQLDVAADEAWMVGDNFEWEVAAPQRLGIRGVWVDHKGNGVADGSSALPYMTIKSLSDLIKAVE
ncbi:HAD family hydrolase [Paenibacillus kobensis]|uniref:HAD family hydrolase n=1 Tax=Paenibacillus kobensis TaxID=59841 RepID=UPI0013E37A4F|nr:HAD family hydrolase [Paenibacillus kobensis]